VPLNDLFTVQRQSPQLERGEALAKIQAMVTVTFQDRATERKALAFLLGRFSGSVLRSGEHLLPEAALEALAGENIPFSVKGKASYEQQVAAIRGAAAAPVQRRPRRSRRVAG
jgi:hypothetical protein